MGASVIAKSLAVLTFHALDDRPSVLSFSPRLFRHGMRLLHEHGYKTLGLAQAVKHVRQGSPFPDHALALTFDDGYQSVYTEALPVLQQYGMTATVFPRLGSRDPAKPISRLPRFEDRTMLSWQEMQEMLRCGLTFGAHTITHPDLTRLAPDQIRAEVCDSKAILEDALSTSVTCFAYPFGRYSELSRNIVSEHFLCACSDTLGLLAAGSDPFTLERVDSYYLRTERLFGLTLTRLFPWYIQTRSIPRQLKRKIRLWG